MYIIEIRYRGKFKWRKNFYNKSDALKYARYCNNKYYAYETLFYKNNKLELWK